MLRKRIKAIELGNGEKGRKVLKLVHGHVTHVLAVAKPPGRRQFQAFRRWC